MQESCSFNSHACQWACSIVILLIIIAASSAATSTAAPTSADQQHASIDTSAGERCGDRIRCDWNIPHIPETGCCPRDLGQTCHPEVGELCNSEFGLKCMDTENSSLSSTQGVGICRGPFNLTATTIARDQAVLEWIHFAPKDYQFEYVLLMKTEAFHRDISRWDVRDCGPAPQCVMRRLTPGTPYLVKMAVWDDIRAGTFGTTTETIVVTTKGVEHCQGATEESLYSVGESFIHEMQNCSCLPTGEVTCHRLCPHEVPEMEEGCQMVLGEGCQYNITCHSNEGFQGSEEKLCSRYPEGTQLRFACRVCRCQGERLECSYTEECSVLSPKPSCENLKEIHIPGICCPEWECEDVCQHDNKSYSAGELFQSENCGLCQCQPSGQVECVSNCPPVEMVPASPSCPSPHVKRSGCCDTLHCFHAESDLFSYVRNLAVLYTTATTLTLGFPVEPLCEIEGLPNYCYYRIQYANTSTTIESQRWKNRIVHPVDILHDDEGSSSPSYPHPLDVLTKDTAIVIQGRAVVTLAGMYPSTEIYVVVTQEDQVRDDMADIDDSLTLSSLTARVVVKTRPMKNVTSCFHSGREVLHGEIVSESCSQACLCHLGQIVCRSSCEDEAMVIAASLSCPRPRLEKMHGECCPTWHCNPSASGCRYNSAVLRPGQVISDGCEECVCHNSTVRCVSMCPPTGVSPRNGCVLVNRSGHCCLQWSCPIEKSIPIAVESSVLLQFVGSCQSPVSHFKKSLSREIVSHVSSVMNCSDITAAWDDLCSGLGVAVECSREISQQGGREKRSSGQDKNVQVFHVLVSVRRNFSSERDQEIVLRAGLDLQKALDSNFSIHLPSGYTVQADHDISLKRPVYICRRGFSYKNGQCELSEIDITGSHWTKITLSPVDVTSQSAIFQWPPFDDSIQTHIKSLHMKYKQAGGVSWMSTNRIPPWGTSVTVSGLEPETPYVGSLVAARYDDIGHDNILDDDDDDDDDDGGESTWTVGDTSFQTLPLYGDKALSSIVITKVSVTSSTIILYWGHVTQEVWEDVEVATILYWVTSSNVIHKLTIHNSEFPFTTIEGLSSSTAYTSQLTVLLSSGRTVRSQSLRLTTLPAEKCEHSFLMPALIVSGGTVSLALVIVLALMCWRYQRKSKTSGIENKLYGVSLENNTAPANTGTSS